MGEGLDKDPVSLRPLGPLEKYSTVRGQLGIYLNVCVTATYRRRSTETLKPAVFRALVTVILKHPVLSAVPAAENSATPYFVRLSQINLEHVVDFVSTKKSVEDAAKDSALDKILEEQHNRPFRHETPLLPYWRLTVLQDPADTSRFTLCFCFHHSLADTKSALVFLEDLEQDFSHPSDTPASTTIPAPETPLLPCMEAIYPLPMSDHYLATQEQAARTEPPPSTWTASPQTLPVRTRFRSLRLPAGTSSALRASAKLHGASLTATLMALLAASFFHVLPPTFTALAGDCAVSLRRFLPEPVTNRSMGCYVGAVSETYSRRASSLAAAAEATAVATSSPWSAVWEDARRTKRTIEEVMGARGADMPVGYLQRVPDMAAWLLGKMGRKRVAAFELSNVGLLSPCGGDVEGEDGGVPRSGDRGNRCVMEGLVFSQSASATAGAVKVSAVTGRDGRLALGFSWQAGVVEDCVVEGVMARLEELAEMVVVESWIT